MKSLISVIVPVYNNERYLERCLESIINQTHRNLEIILVNDGSTDKSGEILNQYAEKDNRIKVIHQENQGPGAARNNGLIKAEGRFVAFVDSDDWIESKMYEKLYEAINKSDSDMVCSNYYVAYSNKSRKEVNIFEEDSVIYNTGINKSLIPKIIAKSPGFSSVFNKLYLREIIVRNNLTFNTKYNRGEDTKFNLNYAVCINSCSFINSKLYNYFQNDQSIMHRYDPLLMEYILEDFKWKIAFIENNKLIDFGIKNIFFNRMGMDVISALLNESNVDLKQLINKIKALSNNQVIDRKYLKLKQYKFIYRILLRLLLNKDNLSISFLSIILRLRTKMLKLK